MAIAIAAALLSSGCGENAAENEDAPGDVRDSVEESEFIVDLRPVGVSTTSGKASVREVGLEVRVEVQHDDDGAGPLPSHIHPGTCPSPDAEPAFILKDARDLPVRTILDVPSDELRELGSLAIDIHAAGDEDGAPIACGDVVYPDTQLPEHAE